MKYAIAYGRNLDLKRMKEKCPHCVLAGKTMLKDWQIAFKRYITLEPCKGGVVPVGVWKLNKEAEAELDIIEGWPTLYRKEVVEIDFEGKREKALVYLINDTHPKYPDKAYLNRVLIGYDDFNFDKKYIFDAIARLPKKKVLIASDKNLEDYVKCCNVVGIETEYGLIIENIDEFDGLLIPGGGDIHPKFYGQKNVSSVKINEKKDKLTFNLMKHFIEKGKAILGICLGCQYINVYFNGTLKQHIENHKNILHKVRTENNILSDYYGKEFEVNSLHHQCVDKLGNGLEVLAVAEDGTIEAILEKNKKVFGVQWHPEKMLDENGKEVFEIFKTML